MYSFHTALAQGVNEITSLPLFTTHPQSAIVTSGSSASVELTCDASNAEQQFQFTRDGVLINERDPSFVIGLRSLTIPNVDESLVGEYVCIANNRVGNVTFSVASAPAFVQLRSMYTYIMYAVCVRSIMATSYLLVSMYHFNH